MGKRETWLSSVPALFSSNAATSRTHLPRYSIMPLCCVSLQENQQGLFTSFQGVRSVKAGPGFIPYCCCSSVEVRDAVQLQSGQYAVVLNDEDSNRRAVYGPCVEWLAPREELIAPGINQCPILTQEEYIVVHDTLTGAKQNQVGPKMFQPGPFDEVTGKQTALNLAKNEYVKIKDEHGRLRVERGEAKIVPQPLEEVLDSHKNNGVKKAVNIDEHHAVTLRNADTGTVELVTEHGLFIPGPYQEDIKVQKKIVLEEYEYMAYKDETGKFHYISGDSEMRNFFLPPFCEVLEQQWSIDLRKEHMEVESVWRFDMRPRYMNYEFNCRTIDNVELIVDVSFYWQIVDVQSMIERTADAPGDICTHARSMIIQAVSNITLMTFLERFNEVIRTGAGVIRVPPAAAPATAIPANPLYSQLSNGSDLSLDAKDVNEPTDVSLPTMLPVVQSQCDPFYEERGVQLLSVEVLQFKCSNPQTDKTLQEIIKETADRLKKKECQKGENEVALSKLEGEIEQERLNKQLIELKKSHLKTESRIEGEAEYHKVAAFLGGCTGEGADEVTVPMDQAVQLYQMLRKLDSVQALADSSSTLYVTPDDVNLTVGQLYPAPKPNK